MSAGNILSEVSRNVLQETTQFLKNSKRRVFHSIREKTGVVESKFLLNTITIYYYYIHIFIILQYLL